jgi:glycosyltransferase involved in cell wall biosynthesis
VDSVITIAMPTRNRILYIDRVLSSVYSQVYPKKKTKLVFVDESTDGTYEQLLLWKKQHDQEYLAIDLAHAESHGFISNARNLCIAKMEGDIIFFWDSDVIAPDPEALTRVINMLGGSAAVSGFPYFTEKPSLYERVMQSETVLGGMGFTAIKKEVFEKAGTFNEKLKVNEDTDFFSRAKNFGYKIKFDGSTPCLHLKKERQSNFRIALRDYRFRLKWCFSNQPFLYRELIKAGSKAHLFRILYYFGLPIILVLWLVNFALPFVPWFPATLLALAYVLFNLCYHVWRAKLNRSWGVVAFLYYSPCGVAVSYGYFMSLFIGFKGKEIS